MGPPTKSGTRKSDRSLLLFKILLQHCNLVLETIRRDLETLETRSHHHRTDKERRSPLVSGRSGPGLRALA